MGRWYLPLVLGVVFQCVWGDVLVAPVRLPWPFRWLHAPKTGSHFAASIADLICNRLRATPGKDHGFHQYKGTEVPESSDCSADDYFGREVHVSLGPHKLSGPIQSFADGHYPSTFQGTAFRKPTLMMARSPSARLRSQYNQGMQHWCESHNNVKNECWNKKLWSSPERSPTDKKHGMDKCARYVDWTKIHGVMGCQSKLFLGRPCSAVELPTPDEMATVEAVLANDTSSLLYVGDTGRWNLSVCLFYATFSTGGRCPPEEAFFPAVRTRVWSGVPKLATCPPGQRDEFDERLFAAATRRVDRDWAAVAHLVRHCPPCAGFPILVPERCFERELENHSQS